MKTIYFAYGMNMNNRHMEDSCPEANNMGAGELIGWGLRERVHADIELSPGETVHGVVWALTDDNIETLDILEGCPFYYVKKFVDVKTKDGVTEALVYVMTPDAVERHEGESFGNGYKHMCASGAEANGIKVDPLFEVETLV